MVFLCGNFSWADRDESGNKIKMVEHKLISFATVPDGFVYPSNFTNKANSHIVKVKIHTRSKLCHFSGCDAKAKLFLSKKCRPGYRAGAFICENFYSGYRYLGRKNRELGSRASPAFHLNTSGFLQRKE